MTTPETFTVEGKEFTSSVHIKNIVKIESSQQLSVRGPVGSPYNGMLYRGAEIDSYTFNKVWFTYENGVEDSFNVYGDNLAFREGHTLLVAHIEEVGAKKPNKTNLFVKNLKTNKFTSQLDVKSFKKIFGFKEVSSDLKHFVLIPVALILGTSGIGSIADNLFYGVTQIAIAAGIIAWLKMMQSKGDNKGRAERIKMGLNNMIGRLSSQA